MSSFSCPVAQILAAEKHSNADRLTIYSVLGYQCISSNLEGGSQRYAVGDLVVYIPEDSILPEWLLKDMEFWDETNKKGILSGGRGNRVKTIKLRKEISQGVLYKVHYGRPDSKDVIGSDDFYYITTENNYWIEVKPEMDCAEMLGIKKHEVIVPESMAGEIGAFAEYTTKYDFENVQKYPTLFDEGDEVVVNEKIHGTLMQWIYSPELDEEFAFERKLLVTSKGIGARGFIILNNEANYDNLYIKMTRKILAENPALIKNLEDACASSGITSFTLFFEVFGASVQDLSYGLKEPDVRLFDIKIKLPAGSYDYVPDGFNDYIPYDNLKTWPENFAPNIKLVPELYRGPFNLEKIKEFRDGKDTINKHNVREGVVIKEINNAKHPRYGRKIGKYISPEYLLRKNATEFQ